MMDAWVWKMEDVTVANDNAMDNVAVDDMAVNAKAVVDAMDREAEYMTWRP